MQSSLRYSRGKKIKKSRKKMSPYTIIGAIVLTLALCGTINYKRVELKAQEKAYASQIKELKKEKAEIKKERKDLDNFKEYVKSDDYAREVAREKFGLVNKGEIIFEPDSE